MKMNKEAAKKKNIISSTSAFIEKEINETVSEEFKARVEATRVTCGYRKSKRLRDAEERRRLSAARLEQAIS